MIFVDTWAWLALAHRRDPYHGIAVKQHRGFQQQNEQYVTSDFVVGELITSLFAAVDFGKAERYVGTMFCSFDAGRDRLIHVSPAQFRRAWQMRQTYHDKPAISFVDLTSMVVMQDLAITEVFTGDAHFQQVGLGFRVVP